MPTKPRYLTKSRFKIAQECPTKLYYHDRKNEYANQKDSNEFLKALAMGGFQVGELAKVMHPEGFGNDIEELDHKIALTRTEKLLTRKNVTIFEAAIQYGDLFIRIDILKKKGKHVELIEVKAKSFDGKDCSDMEQKRSKAPDSKWRPYLEDVAFQKYVLTHAFPEFIVSSYLMLANKKAKATVNQLNQHFTLHENKSGFSYAAISDTLLADPSLIGDSILTRVNVDPIVDYLWYNDKAYDQGFEERIAWYAENHVKGDKIIAPLSSACATCEFRATSEEKAKGLKSGFEECWKHHLQWKDEDFKDPHMFELWDNRRKKRYLENRKFKLADLDAEDIGNPSDIETPDSPMTRTQRQWLQVKKAIRGDSTPYIDKEGLKAKMDSWTYPLHFIDFETSVVAIPFHKDMRPYETVAFQFSHHKVYEDGKIEHANEFLSVDPGYFPNFDFVRALRKALEGDSGSVFRYADHENSVLCQIWQQLEDRKPKDQHALQTFIESITSPTDGVTRPWMPGSRNMIDLLKVIKDYYYHPATKGSNSIKAVLPAILSDSEYLQEKYSQPIYGTDLIPSYNFENHSWITMKEGQVVDPYKQLPSVIESFDESELENISNTLQKNVADGGAAMMAYAYLQFADYPHELAESTEEALLRYCELDTLAMVFIWKYLSL